MPGPLSHIRVLDLSRVLAGPWAAQNLADLGAEVIKVERPGAGDDTRGWGPPFLKDAEGRDTPEAAYYASVNRNKKSVTLDIGKPAGQAIVKELAVNDFLTSEEWNGVLAKFNRIEWLKPFPNLNFKTTPRHGYAFYRVSPDYTVLELLLPALNPPEVLPPARRVRPAVRRAWRGGST